MSWVAALVVAGSGLAAQVAPSTASTRAAASPAAVADDAMPGGYHPVPAARLLDTRNGTGAPAGLRAAGSTTSLPVLGAHGVPASGVSAVLVTVVATGTTGDGYLTAFPHGVASPQASTLNWTAGRTVSNTALVRVGSGGAVDLRVSGSGAHLVADVVGWVLDPAASPGPGGVTALTPSRLLDTRSGVGAPARPARGGSVLGLAVAGRGGVPASGAGAVVLNVTVADASAGGHVSVSPTDRGPGGASSLNYATGETVANLVTVGLGPDGGVDLRVTSPGTVRLVADVVGWVAVGTPPGPLGAAPVAPTRLLDTRAADGGGAVLGGSRRTVQVSGRGGVPTTGAGAALLNVTVADATYTGHLTVVADGAGVPGSSTLNFEKGRTKASFAVGLLSSSGRLDVVASSGGTLRLVVDVVGWVDGPPADVSAPAVPTGVTATVTGTSVTVRWTPPTDVDPLGYRVERIVNEGQPWQTVLRRPLASTTASSVVDAGAPPGLTVRYEVVAVDPWQNAGPAGSSPTRTVPLTIGTPEAVAPVTGGLLDVDCPTASWCVALERDGAVRTWNGTAWSARTQLLPRRADGDPDAGLDTVSCADATFCVVTRTDDPSVLVWRAGSWRTVGVGRTVSAVSCPTTTHCRLLARPGTVVTFDGDRVLGTTTLPTGVDWSALSCSSATWCAAVGITPNVPYTSYAAVLKGSTWARTRISTGPEVSDVSCPAAGSCVAVGAAGTFWLFGSNGWSGPRTSAALGDADAIAPVLDCPSARWCLSSDWDGTSARFDGSTWRTVTGGLDGFRGRPLRMSCASSTACVRVYPEGTVRWFRGSTWSATTEVAPVSGPLLQLSCSSARACSGLDADGAVRSWNGSVWSTPSRFGAQVIDCPSDGWCLAAGTSASGVSSYRVRSGSAWSGATRLPFQLGELSCPVTGWCMAVDAASATTSVYAGGRWSTPVRLAGAQVGGMLECSGQRFCVVVGERFQRTWDGSRWSVPSTTAMVRPYQLDCTADDWCLVIEQSGRYWQRTRGTAWTGSTAGVGTQSDLSCAGRDFCLAVQAFTGGMGYSVWGGVLQRVASTTDIPGQPGVWGATTSCWAPGECLVAEGPRVIRVSAG